MYMLIKPLDGNHKIVFIVWYSSYWNSGIFFRQHCDGVRGARAVCLHHGGELAGLVQATTPGGGHQGCGEGATRDSHGENH